MELFWESGIHWRILNFLIFLGLLVYFLRQPLKAFWKTRSEQIRIAVTEAHQKRESEEKKMQGLTTRFQAIQGEVNRLLESLKEEGELENRRLIADARIHASKLKQIGERIAAQEVQRARTTLRNEAVKLSLDLAAKLIHENVQPGDKKRLAERYLTRLQEQL